MELRHLRYFATVAEELNFGRAARRLNISQPPLSQQIAALEEELHIKLFNRTNRKVELTNAGRVFLSEARAILRRSDRAILVSQQAHRGEAGQLSIATGEVAMYSILPKLLAAFHKRYPAVSISIRESLTGASVRALKHDEIDCAFVLPPIRDEGIVQRVILEDGLVCVLPVRHRLATAASISVREIVDEPIVIISRQLGGGLWDKIASLFYEAGTLPKVAHEVAGTELAQMLVRCRFGIAIVPASVARIKHSGLVARPLRTNTPKLQLGIAWAESNPSPVLANFLSCLRTECRTYSSPDRTLTAN
jgi:DNA-binding transcriptional LysR family regulator